jgi:hypothetical protein
MSTLGVQRLSQNDTAQRGTPARPTSGRGIPAHLFNNGGAEGVPGVIVNDSGTLIDLRFPHG